MLSSFDDSTPETMTSAAEDNQLAIDIDESSISDEEDRDENLQEQVQKDPYLEVLDQTLSSAGRWAFGVAAIELWVERKDKTRGTILERASGGWWRDPVFADCDDALSKLEDCDDEAQYCPPEPLIPGVGVAGILWSEAGKNTSKLRWRDLRQIADDPDQPRDNGRLELLAKAFGIASGVIFQSCVTGLKGMAIFYARRSVNFEKLSSETNQTYLRTSAELLGSVVSWNQPRLNAIEERRKELQAVLRRVRIKLLTLVRFGMLTKFVESNENVSEENKPESISQNETQTVSSSPSYRKKTVQRMQRAISKSSSQVSQKATTAVKKMVKGGGQLPPPPFTIAQCLFSFLGCFLSLLSLSAINESIKSAGNERGIILAPLGALVTMHYGLTSAPASQPRNSILGVVVATVVSKSISYIPEDILPVWIRIALGPAIAIVATLKLGIPHPPAGAVAVLFASDAASNDWKSLGLLLVGYTEAILFALVFVNLNETKTFPMYWGVPDFRNWLEILKCKLAKLTASKSPSAKRTSNVGPRLVSQSTVATCRRLSFRSEFPEDESQ